MSEIKRLIVAKREGDFLGFRTTSNKLKIEASKKPADPDHHILVTQRSSDPTAPTVEISFTQKPDKHIVLTQTQAGTLHIPGQDETGKITYVPLFPDNKS